MARARNIKPGFFTNDTLADIEPLGRLLFQGLWCHADREGRLVDRPRKLKAEILPYDDCDVGELLNKLDAYGFIYRYSIGGEQFIQVLNFKKHQNPHIKEPASEIPAPESPVQEQCETGSGPADSLIPHPDSLNPHPSSITGAEAPADSAGYPVEFEAAWAEYPKRPGASKKDAHKAWKARVKGGTDPETILAGVRRYAVYCRAAKVEPGYIKQPATFFGPGDHYLSDWTPPPPSGKPTRHPDRFDNMDYTAGVDADGRF